MPTSDEPVLARKMANLLREDAEIVGSSSAVAQVAFGVLGFDDAIDDARDLYGGLWVGGRATLTRSTLQFAPNGANRLIHRGRLDMRIALRDVTEVVTHPGLLTKIVAVHVPGSVVKLRCWGGAAFAEQLRDAAGLPPAQARA